MNPDEHPWLAFWMCYVLIDGVWRLWRLLSWSRPRPRRVRFYAGQCPVCGQAFATKSANGVVVETEGP